MPARELEGERGSPLRLLEVVVEMRFTELDERHRVLEEDPVALSLRHRAIQERTAVPRVSGRRIRRAEPCEDARRVDGKAAALEQRRPVREERQGARKMPAVTVNAAERVVRPHLGERLA